MTPKEPATPETTPDTGPARIFIIGGGLAGMMVAKQLAGLNRRIVLLESSSRLGGKAGAQLMGDHVEDHGYHVFPAWYVNTRKLLSDVGCTENLIPITRYHSVKRGEYPHYVTFPDLSSRNLLGHIFGGPLPWHESLLSLFNALELACEPLRRRAYLDRISVTGFLRSRFYASESLAAYHQQTVLQAIAIPTYEVSAMTLQKLVRAWIASPTPVYSILNGNLDAKFIKPFGEHLRRAGVDIRTNCQVKKLMRVGDRISGFVTEQGLEQEKELTPTENDAFVLATPHRITLDILAGRNIAAATTKAMEESTDPEEYGLAGLAHLRSLPMAALHVHFKRRISDFPPEGHVNLIDSRFAMNVLEVSQHWDELKDRTTLYAIASNYEPLIALGEARAKAVLLEELFQYFPHLKNEPFEAVLQGHENEPLLVNTIGAWHFRPRAKTGVPNLFVAGDYCRTDVDLTTMESAVMSGMQTARAVSAFLGLPRPPAPERLPSAPLPVLMALRAAALPLIAPVGAVKWLQRQVDDILNAKWW